MCVCVRMDVSVCMSVCNLPSNQSFISRQIIIGYGMCVDNHRVAQ